MGPESGQGTIQAASRLNKTPFGFPDGVFVIMIIYFNKIKMCAGTLQHRILLVMINKIVSMGNTLKKDDK